MSISYDQYKNPCNDHFFNNVGAYSIILLVLMSYEKEGNSNENCQVIYDDDFEFENIELSHQLLNFLVLDTQNQVIFQDEGSCSIVITSDGSHLELLKHHNDSNFLEEKFIPMLDLNVIQVPILSRSLELLSHSKVDACNCSNCIILADSCDGKIISNKSQM